MIVDCFPFFNELDLLELRLRTLDAVVDRFVLCEAITTHTGIPKPLSFTENRDRFAAWADRIVHLVDRSPPEAEAWANERRQRNVLAEALDDLAPDDVVLMSDCDEIPRPESLEARPAPGEMLAFEQYLSTYYVNLRSGVPWTGTRAFRVADFPRWGRMHVIRGLTEGVRIVPNGGWHFTYLGDHAKVRAKLLATPHVEYGIPYFRDRYRVDTLIRAGRGLWESDELRWTPIDETFPAPIRDDPERWRELVAERPVDDDGVSARTHVHGVFAYVDDACDGVAVVSGEPDLWAAVGSLRFGARFAGAVTTADALPTLLRGMERPCVVADRLEGLHPGMLLERVRAAFPVVDLVALTRNARSFSALAEVVQGAPLAPGEALGAREIENLHAAAGYTLVRRDCLPMPGFWLDLLAMPEYFALKVGKIRIEGIAKYELADWTATHFITVARRPG